MTQYRDSLSFNISELGECMEAIVLYCKSYRGDVLRAQRLARSVMKYNEDKIPFYISVPEADMILFQKYFEEFDVTFICDEQIILANPKHDLDHIRTMPGNISQQIVKSEFWRLGLSRNYVCLDSDNEFIRGFHVSDFLAPDGHPYTVITEGKEYLEFCARYYLPKVSVNLQRESRLAQELFERRGKVYSFGIPPLVWSTKVWVSLEEEILNPRNQSFADLVVQYPFELRLYGEALLKYRAIPLWPCEDIFKNYLYQSQYFFDKKRGITSDMLSKNYLGIVRQSNWDGEQFGKPRKSLASRGIKNVKRFLRWLAV
jgi:hypothetical protein